MSINSLNCMQDGFFNPDLWQFDAEDERLIQENPLSKDLVKTIMKYGKNYYRKSALYNAVAHKDVEACYILRKGGAQVTADIEKMARTLDCLEIHKILFEVKFINAPEQYGFTLRKKDYMFQTSFELDSQEVAPYEIIKNKISLSTCYEMQSEKGYEGYARTRIVSLGAFYAWAKDLDLYDEQGNNLGMIDGEMLTTAEAKFSFYDHEGNRTAIAYLDEDKTGFTLVHPDKPARVIARMYRNFVAGAPDSWEVKVYHGKDLDPRFIRAFAAFAVDIQDRFKKDL